ncbi:hypothetical protein NXV85_23405 [Bacteroides fragilis]|nr:hypothetical protein [Bacteroides fragilis]
MYGIGFIHRFPKVLDVVTKPRKLVVVLVSGQYQSLLFNANYAFDNKYLAQLSFRRDGASNFGDNAKYGNFFSISAGWNINREKWFHASWVDILKLPVYLMVEVGNRPGFTLSPIRSPIQYLLRMHEESGTLIYDWAIKILTWEKTYTTEFQD